VSIFTPSRSENMLDHVFAENIIECFFLDWEMPRCIKMHDPRQIWIVIGIEPAGQQVVAAPDVQFRRVGLGKVTRRNGAVGRFEWALDKSPQPPRGLHQTQIFQNTFRSRFHHFRESFYARYHDPEGGPAIPAAKFGPGIDSALLRLTQTLTGRSLADLN